MPQRLKIITLGIVVVAIISIFIFVQSKNERNITNTQPENINTTINIPASKINNLNEVLSRLKNEPPTVAEIVGWKTYTSERLGITFQYPPYYLIIEPKEPATPFIGASTLITILEDTPNIRYLIENKDENLDHQASIGFMKTISSDNTESIVQWSENYKRLRGDTDEDIYIDTPVTFLSKDAVAFYGRGYYNFDGIILNHKGYLYQFSVDYDTYDNTKLKGRSDFYQIISTIKFK